MPPTRQDPLLFARFTIVACVVFVFAFRFEYNPFAIRLKTHSVQVQGFYDEIHSKYDSDTLHHRKVRQSNEEPTEPIATEATDPIGTTLAETLAMNNNDVTEEIEIHGSNNMPQTSTRSGTTTAIPDEAAGTVVTTTTVETAPTTVAMTVETEPPATTGPTTSVSATVPMTTTPFVEPTRPVATRLATTTVSTSSLPGIVSTAAREESTPKLTIIATASVCGVIGVIGFVLGAVYIVRKRASTPQVWEGGDNGSTGIHQGILDMETSMAVEKSGNQDVLAHHLPQTGGGLLVEPPPARLRTSSIISAISHATLSTCFPGGGDDAFIRGSLGQLVFKATSPAAANTASSNLNSCKQPTKSVLNSSKVGEQSFTSVSLDMTYECLPNMYPVGDGSDMYIESSFNNHASEANTAGVQAAENCYECSPSPSFVNPLPFCGPGSHGGVKTAALLQTTVPGSQRRGDEAAIGKVVQLTGSLPEVYQNNDENIYEVSDESPEVQVSGITTSMRTPSDQTTYLFPHEPVEELYEGASDQEAYLFPQEPVDELYDGTLPDEVDTEPSEGMMYDLAEECPQYSAFTPPVPRPSPIETSAQAVGEVFEEFFPRSAMVNLGRNDPTGAGTVDLDLLPPPSLVLGFEHLTNSGNDEAVERTVTDAESQQPNPSNDPSQSDLTENEQIVHDFSCLEIGFEGDLLPPPPPLPSPAHPSSASYEDMVPAARGKFFSAATRIQLGIRLAGDHHTTTLRDAEDSTGQDDVDQEDAYIRMHHMGVLGHELQNVLSKLPRK